jgi:hypothetical protein
MILIAVTAISILEEVIGWQKAGQIRERYESKSFFCMF